MFIFAQEMDNRKTLAPFLTYLVWKGSWNAQLKAAIGHLCGQLTSNIIWKHIGEQNKAIYRHDFEKRCSIVGKILPSDVSKLWKPGITLRNSRPAACFRWSVTLKHFVQTGYFGSFLVVLDLEYFYFNTSSIKMFFLFISTTEKVECWWKIHQRWLWNSDFVALQEWSLLHLPSRRLWKKLLCLTEAEGAHENSQWWKTLCLYRAGLWETIHNSWKSEEPPTNSHWCVLDFTYLWSEEVGSLVRNKALPPPSSSSWKYYACIPLVFINVPFLFKWIVSEHLCCNNFHKEAILISWEAQ